MSSGSSRGCSRGSTCGGNIKKANESVPHPTALPVYSRVRRHATRRAEAPCELLGVQQVGKLRIAIHIPRIVRTGRLRVRGSEVQRCSVERRVESLCRPPGSRRLEVPRSRAGEIDDARGRVCLRVTGEVKGKRQRASGIVTISSIQRAPTFNRGRSRFVSAKCPRWFTPNCVSNPSFVRLSGQAMMPALLMRMLSGVRSAMSAFEKARIWAWSARSSFTQRTFAPGIAACKFRIKLRKGDECGAVLRSYLYFLDSILAERLIPRSKKHCGSTEGKDSRSLLADAGICACY